jgi:hypothetical protein
MKKNIVIKKIFYSLIFVLINAIIMLTGILTTANNFTMDIYQKEH